MDSAIKINWWYTHTTGLGSIGTWWIKTNHRWLPAVGSIFVKHKYRQSLPTMVETGVETESEIGVWLAGGISYLSCPWDQIPDRRNQRKAGFTGAHSSRVWLLKVRNHGNRSWRQLFILYLPPGREGAERCWTCTQLARCFFGLAIWMRLPTSIT